MNEQQTTQVDPSIVPSIDVELGHQVENLKDGTGGPGGAGVVKTDTVNVAVQ